MIPSCLKGKLCEGKKELKQGDSVKSISISFILYNPRDEGNSAEGQEGGYVLFKNVQLFPHKGDLFGGDLSRRLEDEFHMSGCVSTC